MYTFLFSQHNPCAQLRLNMVHHIGRRGARPRPVVNNNLQQFICMVMSYSKQLNSTPFSMSEQLPPSVHERRTAQIPQIIKLCNKAQSQNISADIKLVKDKFIVNNKLKSDTFESNPVKYVTPTEDVITFDTIQHSNHIGGFLLVFKITLLIAK